MGINAGKGNRSTRPQGAVIDALGDLHHISALCQTCQHTAPVPISVIKSRRHLARNGLLADLHPYLRCTRCNGRNALLLFATYIDVPRHP